MSSRPLYLELVETYRRRIVHITLEGEYPTLCGKDSSGLDWRLINKYPAGAFKPANWKGLCKSCLRSWKAANR